MRLPRRHNQINTPHVKTAFSLPDELYRNASAAAEQFGIPRSRLFARPVEDYVKHQSHELVTARIEEVPAQTVAPLHEASGSVRCRNPHRANLFTSNRIN